MSDHAGTIRRALAYWSDTSIGSEEEREVHDGALAALGALVESRELIVEALDMAVGALDLATQALAGGELPQRAVLSAKLQTATQELRAKISAALAAGG